MTKHKFVLACLALMAVLLWAGMVPASADLPISISPPPPLPTGEASPSPSPSPTKAAPSESPSVAPNNGGNNGSGNESPPASQPGGPGAVPGNPSSGQSGDQAGGFPIPIPEIARTPPNNSEKLLEILSVITERGIPLDQVIVLAAPPFPVAGLVTYSDDWQLPRLGPPPHLHEGTDIFAAIGTPIVASGPGVIAGMGEATLGGTSVWVAGDDGTGFFYTHLSAYADGEAVGQRVDTGTVIGYVGNSGNAITTPPHLHFEIHPPVKDPKGRIVAGGVTTQPNGLGKTNAPAVDPKPYLDAWLAQAELRAQSIVNSFMERFAQISRGFHFAQRVDQLYSSDLSDQPPDVMFLSTMDPVLSSLGLARQALVVANFSRPPGSLAELKAEQLRLESVRLAVARLDVQLASLAGELGTHIGE